MDRFGLKNTFKLAGASIGMGIIGESFSSTGLKQGGQVAAGAIPIMVNIGMGGYLIRQLKVLKVK